MYTLLRSENEICIFFVISHNVSLPVFFGKCEDIYVKSMALPATHILVGWPLHGWRYNCHFTVEESTEADTNLPVPDSLPSCSPFSL